MRWKIIVSTVAASAIISSIVPVMASGTKKLYLDIDFEKNIIFDKYDVDVYLDDDKIDTLPHGERYTKLIDVEETGKHLLTFYKEDDHTISEIKQIDIENEETTFSCRMVSHSSEIDIKDVSITDNIEGSSIEIPDLTHVGLSDAYKQLKELGFVNIKSNNLKGSSVSSSNSYIVLSQNIEPETKIDKNAEINLTCQKVSEFMEEHFVGLGIDDAQKEADSLGYGYTFFRTLTKKDMDESIQNMDKEEKGGWIVDQCDLNNNTAELGLRFSGKRVCPDVTGLSLKEAEQLLEENDFENHGYEVVTDDWVWNKNNWQVIYQSVPAGEVTDVATEIELKVQSYDSIKENGILLGENETISDNAVAVESIDGTEVETEIEDDTLGDMLEEETEDIDEAETTVSTENTDDLTSETSSEQIEIDPNDIEIIKSVQVALNEAGYDCGTADGIVGENTRNAIIAYEKASGITEDGEITGELVKSLGIIDGYNTSDFTQELAERAAVVAMMNCYAMDVYTDGDYDPQKFHVYGENSEYLLSIYQEGVWEKVNDNTWHVDEMILRKDDSTTDFYLRVFLDVTFDGRNYIVSNVKENHQKLEYIYDTDPSKYCYSEYEPSDANPFLTVSPEMIYDNTSEKLESEKTIESQETEGKTNKKDELPESTAKRAFEYMGEALYPYGFKCHWFTGTMVHEQYNDGSWFFKVQVTVTNKYGTEKDAIAEALVNNTTEAVEDFKLYDK